MTINIWHMIGIAATLVLIAAVGVYSGRKVKDAKDFTTGGGKAGALLVCGAILGSLVSGQATIGTAQLAFSYGMSAWWFTLGSGIGCLVLGIAYVVPLRKSGNVTLLEVISDEYGKKAEYIGSILCSAGIFISVIAQILSACALLRAIFSMSAVSAGAIAVALMIIYVVFGGAWGAGMGGVIKLFLLYMASVAGCAIVLACGGGLSGILESIKELLLGSTLGNDSVNSLGNSLGNSLAIYTASDISGRFMNMLARGSAKDIGSGLSLLLGVLSTQTYAQAIWTGKSDSASRKGAFLSALLIPPIGIACTLIGLFMRGRCITADEVSMLTSAGKEIPQGLIQIETTSQVFPVFIVHYMPSLLGGIVLGTLFITVIGGGAGLSLGVATILVNDIFKKISSKIDTAAKNLVVTRITIVAVLLAAMAIASIVPGAVINDFGFLSMGLRGTVVFLPMTAALFLKGKIDSSWTIISMITGPLAVLACKFLSTPVDPLFPGIGISFLCLCVGFYRKSAR